MGVPLGTCRWWQKGARVVMPASPDGPVRTRCAKRERRSWARTQVYGRVGRASGGWVHVDGSEVTVGWAVAKGTPFMTARVRDNRLAHAWVVRVMRMSQRGSWIARVVCVKIVAGGHKRQRRTTRAR